jgi:hypothetical protein
MPTQYTCPLCYLTFDHPAGVIYPREDVKLIVCPHCEGQFEALPTKGTLNHGVDPKGVV